MSRNRMTYKECRDLLIAKGFRLVRAKKHQVWKKDSGEIISLPIVMRKGEIVEGPIINRLLSVKD